MIATTNERRSAAAAIDAVDSILTRYRTQLEWIAVFVTGEETSAAACAIDACGLTESRRPAQEDWLIECAGRATLAAAIQSQRLRIDQLSSIYEGRTCGHDSHDPLPRTSLEFAVVETDL